MTVVTRKILKTFFQKGSKPSEEQFRALIDSFVHVAEDKSRLGLAEFDRAASYSKGSSVIFKGDIYQALSAVSPGSFKDTEWRKLYEAAQQETTSTAAKDGFEGTGQAKTSEDTGPGSKWIKFQVDYSELKESSASKPVAVLPLPAGLVLAGLIVRLQNSFTGPGISGISISLGTKGDKSKYLEAFDVSQKVSTKAFKEVQLFTLSSWDKKTDVFLIANFEAGTPDQLQAGLLEVRLLTIPIN